MLLCGKKIVILTDVKSLSITVSCQTGWWSSIKLVRFSVICSMNSKLESLTRRNSNFYYKNLLKSASIKKLQTSGFYGKFFHNR